MPPEYDYVIYLDSDIGIKNPVIPSSVENWFRNNLSNATSWATTTYRFVRDEYTLFQHSQPSLFSEKFLLYSMQDSWNGAHIPSEHFMIFQNGPQVKLFASELQRFCDLYENRPTHLSNVGTRNEGFEIGISAHLAGFTMDEISN